MIDTTTAISLTKLQEFLTLPKMQRQSLGSPGSKQQHHSSFSSIATTDDDDDDERKRRRSKSGASSPSSSPGSLLNGHDGNKRKLDKAVRSGTDKTIHLIPLLTFLCFLVLYLFSHDPSPKDMEAFERFATGVDSQGAAGATEGGRLIRTGTTVRSNRKLKEICGGGGRKMGCRWRM